MGNIAVERVYVSHPGDVVKVFALIDQEDEITRYNIASYADRHLKIAGERLRHIKAHLGS